MEVPDLDHLTCATSSQHGNRSLVDLTTMDLLCPYTTECDSWVCDCCHKQDCYCSAGCYDNCECFHKRDHSINFMNCTSRNMSSLPPKLPLYVKTIFLDGNNLPKLSSLLLRFESVERLLLNKSQVRIIKPAAFQNLRHITEIFLQDNFIRIIGNQTFSGIPTLEKLCLQNNSIEAIDIDSFEHLYNINSLSLQNNKLTHLNYSNFEKLNRLEDLSLHGNPWYCDCTFGHGFQEWLIATEYIPEKGKISCEKIIEKSGRMIGTVNVMTPLIQIDFSFCIEPDKTETTVAVVSTTLTFLVLGIVTIICFKNRLLFMILAYNHFGLRFKNEDEDDEERPYDVYIAQSKQDDHFVVHQLLPGLEQGQMPYKVR